MNLAEKYLNGISQNYLVHNTNNYVKDYQMLVDNLYNSKKYN